MTPRFIVKFNNGYWKVFDTVQYRDLDICGLKTDADALAADANANPKKYVKK